MWRTDDYAYELPAELVAQQPPARREDARLLVVGDGLEDRRIPELVDLVPADAVVVVNDTRVIPARLRARKPSGGAVELLLLEPAAAGEAPRRWRALARASKPIRPGELELLAGDEPTGVRVAISARSDDGIVEVELGPRPFELLDRLGEVPLPPYIERAPGGQPEDRERYQTVYARAPGAVAAPTAGLHLTPTLLAALEARGVALAHLTLHVGLGTFAPVRVTDLHDHEMHAERFEIPPATAALIASGRPVVAIGTTVVRALEAAATGPRAVRPGPGITDLFIGPGFDFRVVDHLLTNFHLPASTLLVLVSAFAGRERVLAAYRHAVAARYRFFSYGDAMLLSRPPLSAP
jgi:S-adenosylmethionine:tRNA ribosyltransferase-isomerase